MTLFWTETHLNFTLGLWTIKGVICSLILLLVCQPSDLLTQKKLYNTKYNSIMSRYSVILVWLGLSYYRTTEIESIIAKLSPNAINILKYPKKIPSKPKNHHRHYLRRLKVIWVLRVLIKLSLGDLEICMKKSSKLTL